MESNQNSGVGMRVRMLGGWSIEYQAVPIHFARGSNTKFLQLLALLLLGGKEGVPKKELISSLYSAEDIGNVNRNLNNVIYRLKKQLAAAGLPEEDYISLENGICRFFCSFPVEVDVLAFREMAEEGLNAEADQKRELLRNALRLYTGDFLPEFSAEPWAIRKMLEYKKLYERSVEEMVKCLEEDGNRKEERELYRRTAWLYPYDGWQVRELDCLISMKEYEEAYSVYYETARLYSEELGMPPGEELLKRLHKMERLMLHPVGSFEEIAAVLRREDTGGAYFCYYPSFLDSCRLLARMAERSGQSIFLLLCTMTERGGKVFTDREKLEAQMELLKTAIGATFRKGDLYTRYSKNQFLVILIGTEQENCIVAFDRLLKRWRVTDGAAGELSYSMEPLLRLLGVDEKQSDNPPKWGKIEKLWKS